MVIRGSRKLLIKQLDTSLIQENFVRARGRDAHQIGPRVMVFDADRVFAHGICTALDRGCAAQRIALKLQAERPLAQGGGAADTKASRRGNGILPCLRAPDSFKRLLGGAPTSPVRSILASAPPSTPSSPSHTWPRQGSVVMSVTLTSGT